MKIIRKFPTVKEDSGNSDQNSRMADGLMTEEAKTDR